MSSCCEAIFGFHILMASILKSNITNSEQNMTRIHMLRSFHTAIPRFVNEGDLYLTATARYFDIFCYSKKQ